MQMAHFVVSSQKRLDCDAAIDLERNRPYYFCQR